jgi:HTH-type transcriptional regulator, sugar sensing transcriptional regulator
MLKNELVGLGLTEAEASIYIAVLGAGPSSILDISRNAHLNRSTIYYAIQALKEKHLIGETVRGKKKLLFAEDLVGLKRSLEQKVLRIDDLAAEAKAMAKGAGGKPVLRFSQGLDGIKAVFESAAHAKEKAMYGIVGLDKLNESSKALLEYWGGPYTKLRKKYGTIAKLVMPDTPQSVEYKKLDAERLRETKLVPVSSYNFESEFLVHDDVTDLFVFTKQEQFAISIQSGAIANTMKMIWRIVWNQAY